MRRASSPADGEPTIRGRWTRSVIVAVVAAQGASGELIGSIGQVQASTGVDRGERRPADRDGDFVRDLRGGSKYSGLFVVTRGFDSVTRVRAAITKIGFSSSAPESLITSVRRYSSVVEIVLSAIGLIALGIAALGIANAMLAAVRERRREIGVLKAIGARDRDVRRVFLVEAAILGVSRRGRRHAARVLLARLVGLAVNQYLTGQGLKGVSIGLPLGVVATGVVGSGLLALVAGTVPAQRAAHLARPRDGWRVSARRAAGRRCSARAVLRSGCGRGVRRRARAHPKTKGPRRSTSRSAATTTAAAERPGRGVAAGAVPHRVADRGRRSSTSPGPRARASPTSWRGRSTLRCGSRPDLVTITVLDDAELGTDPALVELDLMRIVRELRMNRQDEDLIGTVPDGTAAPPVGGGPSTRPSPGWCRNQERRSSTSTPVAGSDDETTAAHIACTFAAAPPCSSGLGVYACLGLFRSIHDGDDDAITAPSTPTKPGRTTTPAASARASTQPRKRRRRFVDPGQLCSFVRVCVAASAICACSGGRARCVESLHLSPPFRWGAGGEFPGGRGARRGHGARARRRGSSAARGGRRRG